MDRPRRAGRRRRRRRRLHVARVRRRDPPRLPQARAAAWSPASTSTPRRQAVLRATVAFAREVGARVVAEGVERPEELAVLRDAEVDFGQGWLFGRPARRGRAEPETAAAAARRARRRRAPRARARLRRRRVRDASTVVVEHLARTGLMPSVYLEQGGRLRCQAVRGYWQIYDGMPPSAGVIGRTFRTGARPRSSTRSAQPGLPALGPVRRRRALPAAARRRARRRRAQRRVADALGEDARWELERCADLLARRDRAARRARGRRVARPSGWPAPSRGWPRSRIPRTSCARPSRAALEARRLRVRDARARRRPRRPLRPPRRGLVRGRASPTSTRRPRPRSPPGSATARRPTRVDEAAGRGFAGHEPLRQRRRRVAGRAAAGGRRRAARACSCWPTARRTGSRPSRSSCSSCSPSRPPAACGWRPPCSSCASAPRATR